MPKKIKISGDIGWETMPYMVIDALRSAKGDDLDIEIASPGGSVFDGIEIYNAIQDYKRENPGAKIVIYIKGLAASMASYIAMVPAASKIVIEENAVFMIHNPWMFAVGDYREMRKSGDFLAGLAGILAKAYVRKTGKQMKDIVDLMDSETWLFGSEIVDAGFADNTMPSEEQQDEGSAAAISRAKLQFQALQTKLRENAPEPEKAAAIMRLVTGAQAQATTTIVNPPAVSGKTTTPEGATRGKAMDAKELQTNHPDTYAAVHAAGVKAEQDRVAALAAMKKDPLYAKIGPVQDVLDDAIATGKTKEEATARIMAVLASNSTQAALESPGDLNPGKGVNTPSGETAKPSGQVAPVTEV